jgi:K+-transporting ATPase KdpF subunit
MTAANVIGVSVAALVALYLIYALLRGEKF